MIDSDDAQDPPARPDRGLAALDAGLDATLDDLERATRNFSVRFGGARPTRRDEPEAPTFEDRMRDAEREATAYLESAKRRADSVVKAMVEAVEREAVEMRREAEAGIRARRQAVEVDASRRLEEARRVAERLVAERQRRIASLSDGITGRAEALTAGLEDAERVRDQFDSFVRALSRAAGLVAAEAAGPPPPGPLEHRGEDALAA
jgi:hypothetical protein